MKPLLEKHLGDAWHLIREPNQRHRVVIRFSSLVARNVAEVRWHKTQACHFLPDGRLDFEVTVDGLTEIVWWILGYGEHAEVLEPPELREVLKHRIQKMRSVYSGKRPKS